jgi:hypothetical protein
VTLGTTLAVSETLSSVFSFELDGTFPVLTVAGWNLVWGGQSYNAMIGLFVHFYHFLAFFLLFIFEFKVYPFSSFFYRNHPKLHHNF